MASHSHRTAAWSPVLENKNCETQPLASRHARLYATAHEPRRTPANRYAHDRTRSLARSAPTVSAERFGR